ncbi:unnamed protein product [Blepharisma stoltei]|uniref:Uncharacterized protein n=1 Tax=Blepharisma stoltei TaxID=1481888 RepID=A0AAU9K507_9CILI|nr:unnamed protein product [Blepharisma stoltei]
MADLYLEEQRIKTEEFLVEQKIKIEEFSIMLTALYINDSDHHRQLQTEFNTLSALPKNIDNMIKKYKDDLRIQCFYRDFAKQCRITQILLNKKIFKIHKQNYNNSYNSDFNYLYNTDENLNGTEIYIYDIKSHKRTSTCELKSYKPNRRLMSKIANYVKISNSHLLILGAAEQYSRKGLLMDLKTKAITEMFNFNSQKDVFDTFNQFIYYDNYLFVFGNLGMSGLAKYDINRNKWQKLAFPQLDRRVFAVLFHNYVLVSSFYNSTFYLYDFLINSHSEIGFYEHVENRKFLFTNQIRVYLWIQNNSIYESEENNPFKWNIIGNNNFGIRELPFDITFSSFEGNIYASLLIRPKMYCYKLNRESKEIELIYQGEVNR